MLKNCVNKAFQLSNNRGGYLELQLPNRGRGASGYCERFVPVPRLIISEVERYFLLT